MNYNWSLRAAYNGLMYGMSIIMGTVLIQHAMFFYTFPPDLSRWTNINPMCYLFVGVTLFFYLKALHWVEVKAEVAYEELHNLEE